MTRHSAICFLAVSTSLLVALGRSGVLAQAAEPAASSECGTDNLLAGMAPSQSQDVRGNALLVTDGAVAPEGAQWNAPLAVTFDSGAASLTYDLGRPQSVAALYIQADANDSYQITGSLDGSQSSYKPLAEIENVVVSRGHGLRARVLQFAPVSARYVRVGQGRGDGFYSISELSLYCRAPTRFPPVMRIVSAPMAEVQALSRPLAVESNAQSLRSILLLAAALFAFVGFGQALFLSVQRKASLRSERPAPGEPSPLEESEKPEAHAAVVRGWPVHDLLRLLFMASGCAALIYEIVWFHLLRLVIGASALSVGIVLASFMGGMFLGSLFYARLIPPTRHPLRVYAVLEIGIGVFGVLMPLLLPAARLAYVGLFGYGALGIALRAVIAAVLLLPPTALMGATLPAVARRYAHGRRGTSGLASLYAANTAGAVLGCLLCAFYLLAIWDVWVATFVAVALNFAVGGCALRLARVASPELRPPMPVAARSQLERSRETYVVYLAAGLSGLTALGGQVVWTRLLTLLFGATVYAFAIILAVFLAGLGLGSALAAYLLRRGQRPLHGLAWSQVALVPALLWAGQLLAEVLPFASPSLLTPVRSLHALHVLRAIDVIFPAALCWGASFPFALAAASANDADASRSSGHVYAANTIGAIAGALAISFWVIPTWGTQVAQQSLVLGAAISAATLFHAIRRAPERSSMTRSSRTLYPILALAAGALAAALLPGLSTVFLAHGRYIWWVDPRDQYPYVSEGAASTVAVHIGPDGHRNFHVSGRVEATNNPADLRLERLLGHLSALAHPRPESVLVVGLGGGITAGAISLHPEVKRIVICEIEPRVVGAAKQFAPENYSVLSDPRVEIVFDDARHFLATTKERFDIITSDPIHPWVRGNSVLFSREYYAIVRERLKPHGIATQWVPLYETSELAIQIQMRTFMDAFPNGTVWNSSSIGRGYDVVLLGRAEPLHLPLLAIQQRIDQSPRILESLQKVKLGSAVDLLATYGASGHDMKGWLAGVPVNRDFSLKLEYISGLALNQQESDPIYAHMIAKRSFPDDLFEAPDTMREALRHRILGDAAVPAPH